MAAMQQYKALLEFCLKHTKGEDVDASASAKQMSKEDQEWLTNMLQDSMVDVSKELAKCINCILETHTSWTSDDSAEVEKALEALESMNDWVELPDLGQTFDHLGGFECLELCLKSENDLIIFEACNAIANLSQNYPYVQTRILQKGLLHQMIEILKDTQRAYGMDCKVKAVYGISCSVRGSRDAVQYFAEHEGVKALYIALNVTKPHEKLVTKACFFLKSMISGADLPDEESRTCIAEIREQMGTTKFASLLLKLLSAPLSSYHEMAASLMLSMVETMPSVVQELRAIECAFDDLSKLRKALDNDDDSEMIRLVVSQIMVTVFPVNRD